MSALEIASLYGTIALNDQFTTQLGIVMQSLGSFEGRLRDIGARTSELGFALGTIFAVPALAFGRATDSAVDFNRVVTNSAAILGLNQEQARSLSDELLDIGAHSMAGPMGVARAYYEVASGVLNAGSRMPILHAAIATSEAGQADLMGTTMAMISIMNAFGYTTEAEATRVGDAITRMVGVGIGSMDQFSAALPKVTGLAAQVGISFDEVASSMAFITTKGFTPGQASTQLAGIINAFLKPNTTMKGLMGGLGWESGSAAMGQFGLVGTIQRLFAATGGSEDVLSQALGRREALLGSLALLQQGYGDFAPGFMGSIGGSTEAARDIQRTAPGAQRDLFNAQLAALGITIGDALIPGLSQLMQQLSPIVEAFRAWAAANPEVVAGIGQIVIGGAGLAVFLFGLGQLIRSIGIIVGALASPVTGAIVLIGLLGAAYTTNFLGFRDFVDNEVRPALEGFADTVRGLPDPVRAAAISIGALGLAGAIAMALGLGPLGLGIIAIGLVIAAYNSNFLGFKTAIDNITLSLEAASPAARALVTIVGALGVAVMGATLLGLGPFGAAIILVGGLLAAYLGNFLGFRDFVDDLGNKLRTVVNFLIALPGLLGQALQEIARQFNDNPILTLLTGGRKEITIDGNMLLQRMQQQQGASRDAGGSGVPGESYLIGRGAQPELFVPQTAGAFYPADQWMSKGGITINGNIVIQASNFEEGRAAASGFQARMEELMRMRG